MNQELLDKMVDDHLQTLTALEARVRDLEQRLRASEAFADGAVRDWQHFKRKLELAEELIERLKEYAQRGLKMGLSFAFERGEMDGIPDYLFAQFIDPSTPEA